MKKTIYTILFGALTTTFSAQVSIGGKQSVEGISTILDFNNPLSDNTMTTTNNNYRGIILPAVDNTNNALASNPSENNGTFVFDKSDKKVKVYEGDMWKSLTDGGGSLAAIVTNTSQDTNSVQGVIIGASKSDAKGVLVLESPKMAMILPRIANPDTTVKSPHPGMICYDTVSKTIAMYDGAVWSFYK